MGSSKKKQLHLFGEDLDSVSISMLKHSRKQANRHPSVPFRLIELPSDTIDYNEKLDIKTIRENLNLSLDEVHLKTKIPTKHIIALESNNRDFLPPIHVRAFLRTLGNLYNVDWNKFSPPEAVVPPLPQIKSLEDFSFEEPKLTFWQRALLFLLTIPKSFRREKFPKAD